MIRKMIDSNAIKAEAGKFLFRLILCEKTPASGLLRAALMGLNFPDLLF